MLLLMAVTVLAILILYPETEIARALKRLLIEAPSRGLARVTRGRVALLVILGLIGAGLFLLFEADGLRLFAFMLPDVAGWLVAFDVSLFMDAAIVALAAANATRLGPVRQKIADRGLVLASAVATRTRRAARALRTAAMRVIALRPNDDHDRMGWAQPAFG